MKVERRRWRAAVYERDRGVCSECGLDTEELFKAWKVARFADHATSTAYCVRCQASIPPERRRWQACPSCLSIGTVRTQPDTVHRLAVRGRLVALGFPADMVKNHGAEFPLWQADHRVPLSEDGPDTLENLRTLCVPCHGRWTAALAARRAYLKASRDKCKTCRAIGGPCMKHGGGNAASL